MNATIRSTNQALELIERARELSQEAPLPTARTLLNLVAEIEALREAARGSLAIVQQASASLALSQLQATTLLLIAKKLQPVIDQEIEDRKAGGNDEDWALLQVLSDELHAAIRLAAAP